MTLANPSSTPSDASLPQEATNRLGVRWSLKQTIKFVEQCYDRDTLIDTLFGFSERWLSNRMVLVLGNQQAKLYQIRGWPELDEQFRDPETIRNIRIDLPPDAALFNQEYADLAMAKRPEDIGLGQLFVKLTLFPPEQILFQIVQIGARPAMVLIGEPLESVRADLHKELPACAQAVGEQLAEILRLSRADELAVIDQRIPPVPSPDLAATEEDAEYDELFESVNNGSVQPGLAVDSSMSEASVDPEPTAGSTAYGLPFIDKNGAIEDTSETAFGLPFADMAPSAEIAAPGSPQNDAQSPDDHPQRKPASSDISLAPNAAGNADKQKNLESTESSERIASQQPTPSSTMSGGFSVADFAPPGEDDARESAVKNDQTTQSAGASKSEKKSPFAGSMPSATSAAPKAQILRPVSLKKGRQSGRFKAARPAAAQDNKSSADASSTEAIPSSDAHSSAFQDQIDRFPGKLSVDRYKYNPATLPPVEDHGPMLAKLVANAHESVELARHFLGHTSNELRFYATYLFSALPVNEAIIPLLERLFDRDHQTRECAKRIASGLLPTNSQAR